jgi:hypothetical protein
MCCNRSRRSSPIRTEWCKEDQTIRWARFDPGTPRCRSSAAAPAPTTMCLLATGGYPAAVPVEWGELERRKPGSCPASSGSVVCSGSPSSSPLAGPGCRPSVARRAGARLLIAPPAMWVISMTRELSG